MTEQVWLGLTRIDALKPFAFRHPKATERQRMLFACACCRLAQDWGLPDLEGDAIDATERHIDGGISQRTWMKRRSALDARDGAWARAATPWDHDFRRAVISLFYLSPEWSVPNDLISSVARISDPEYAERFEAKLCAALRDIFGNVFREAVLAPEWRTETAAAIAQQMYDTRDFSAVPILADALQDAGCDNDDALNHCRDPKQTHVRGCWVVDLVLGKR